SDDSVPRLSRQFPQVALLANQKNLGFAEGNNRGIQYALDAGCRYILLLNNDATLPPQAASQLIRELDRDPTIGIIGPRIYLADQPDRVWFGGGKVDPELGLPIHLEWMKSEPTRDIGLREVDYICGCALLARSEVFAQVGMFDLDYFLLFEDTDLCARARQAGYRVVLAPWVSAYHKVSATFGGDRSPDYRYYFHRNNLIYVAKRQRGPDQRRVLLRVARREWGYVRDAWREQGTGALPLARAACRASVDFITRRWGRAGG
ncbi:MAG TPA: glycosyltransferase family 2 protein, partial [Chloroflexota bacterium]|nr:glycosyltransferase family 2 protein [Chloroflexota bacterium]